MNSKQKGNNGEREFAQYCRDHGFDVYRNPQNGEKGSIDNPDVKGIQGVHVEVKRVEKLNINHRAMNQAISDAAGQTADFISACRRERCAWWNDKRQECVMIAISELYKLHEINDSLENIGDMLKY